MELVQALSLPAFLPIQFGRPVCAGPVCPAPYAQGAKKATEPWPVFERFLRPKKLVPEVRLELT